MAYEKQTWVTGEVITKEKLNHMEDGIANGIMIVTADPQTTKLNKTFNELKNAFKANIPLVYMSYNESYARGVCALFDGIWEEEGGVYGIAADNQEFTTTDPDDYPSLNGENDT